MNDFQILDEVTLEQAPNRHEFLAIAVAEEEGGYSIFAAHYPEVISQGDTIEEAKENIADAFLEILAVHREQGTGLEYSHQPVVECVHGENRPLWISVNG